MRRQASFLLWAIPLLVPASVLAATFSGPPAGVTPPAGNVPGLILNFQDSNDPNAAQAGAQIRIGSSGAEQKIFGRVTLSNGGILGPSFPSFASSTIGNYLPGGFYPYQLVVKGGLNVDVNASPPANGPATDGRVQARKFCLNPVSGAPDCITSWPTPAAAPDPGAYVQKAGDTMTGTLNVTTGAIPYGVYSSGASAALVGVGTNYGVYGRSTLSNGYGLFGQNTVGFGMFADGNIGGRLRGQTTGAEIYALAPVSTGIHVDGSKTQAYIAEGGSRAMRLETTDAEGLVLDQSSAPSPSYGIRVTQPAGKGTGLTLNGSSRGINITGVTGLNSQGMVIQSENQGLFVDINNPVGAQPEAGRFEIGSGGTLRQVILGENGGDAIDARGSVTIRDLGGNDVLTVGTDGQVHAKGPAAGFYFHDRGASSKSWAWYASGGEGRLWTASTGDMLRVQETTGNVYNRKNVSTWDVASDARLKDVKGPYQRGLDEILQVRTVDFRYKDLPEKNLSSAELRHGVVAQQLAKVFPDAVTHGSDGYYSVNADPVFWASVNAIQELKAENDARRAENERLKARIERLEAKLK